MTPEQAVEAFLMLTSKCLDTLSELYGGSDRPAVGTGTALPRNSKGAIRSGKLPGLGTFERHGRGCRFELRAGEDLDVDWDEEGRAVFNSWRLLMFANSVGYTSADRESLRLAAARSPNTTQIAADWFTWPDKRHDLTMT